MKFIKLIKAEQEENSEEDFLKQRYSSAEIEAIKSFHPSVEALKCIKGEVSDEEWLGRMTGSELIEAIEDDIRDTEEDIEYNRYDEDKKYDSESEIYNYRHYILPEIDRDSNYMVIRTYQYPIGGFAFEKIKE